MNSIEIQPIVATSEDPVYVWGNPVFPVEVFSRSIGHPQMADREGILSLPPYIADPHLDRNENGWWFGTGDPEFWKFQDKLLVPGGKVLDLGIGVGRTAFPFALRGMFVIGYENDPDQSSILESVLNAYDFLPIELRNENIATAELGESEYDTVLLGQTLTHQASIEDALLILDKAIAALKPGGHLWLRTGGKESDAYMEFRESAMFGYDGVQQINENVFSVMGGHGGHGGHNGGYSLFFGQTELMVYLAQRGISIVHSQVVPSEGQMNIMYGEDWRKDRGIWLGGMITLIGEKPTK